MYFSYVPSIIFSFFNRPLFLNLLFKQILIHYYSLLFIIIHYYSFVPLIGTQELEQDAEFYRSPEVEHPLY